LHTAKYLPEKKFTFFFRNYFLEEKNNLQEKIKFHPRKLKSFHSLGLVGRERRGGCKVGKGSTRAWWEK